jgi:hypothetical protein
MDLPPCGQTARSLTIKRVALFIMVYLVLSARCTFYFAGLPASTEGPNQRERISEHEKPHQSQTRAYQMTKVRINVNFLAYRLKIRDSLREFVIRNYISGATQPYVAKTPLAQEDVLAPPSIGFIILDGYRGQGDDYIDLAVSHDFGLHALHITIMDDQGNVIESDEASPYLTDPNLWEYLPQARVPSGTKVIVQVTAIDHMGGVGMRREEKTMGEQEF